MVLTPYMDTPFQDYPNMMNNLKFDHGPVPCSSSRDLVIPGCEPGYKNFNPHPSFHSINPHPPNKSPSSSPTSSGLSSEVDNQDNNTVLKYISDILMEEDLEGKTCMLQDCLALQATEKPFYDVLGQEYPYNSCDCDSPPFSCNSCQTVETSDDSFNWSSSNYPAAVSNYSTQSCMNLLASEASVVDTSESTLRGPNFGGDIWQSGVVSIGCGAGMPFPNGGSFVFARQANSYSTSSDEETDSSPENSWGRKNHHREEGDHIEEERSNKQAATSLAEPEAPSEMFDEVLLCPPESVGYAQCTSINSSESGASRSVQRKGTSGRRSRGKKQGNKEELIDLWTLLTQCAQAVAGNDQRTSNELLKQIRRHSTPYGDVNQRLAHYFARALETRLEGTRTPAYSPFFFLASNKSKMVDILKAYQVYVKACPFKRMSFSFANRTILKQAEKASRLHIIDFGILYGFQWPCLIQRLSERSIGPPKLKITGIELPQPGFRPAERVEETIQRLKKYCERFRVPFEYHVIAKKWETIKYADLNIDRDEMIVVNSMYRLKNIPDDTVASVSARDTVLNLINQIKPDLFLLGVVNGTYSAPFFVTRFKEALFHFSSYFDMFEATVPREDEGRILFEKEIFARDLSNAVACEGTERVERPETYKQWQTRNLRAGFRQIPLDKDILKKVRDKMMIDYDKDFVLGEDGMWMLQGWKGRITHALSVWKPVHE